MSVQQQPMTPMSFYADPNRFPAPVWQADPTQVSGWQGQFIQQIPSTAPPIDTYQQYPNGIYQTTYQQPAFETNTFYTGAVQVLTPANTRPPSVPNQQQVQMVPPRPSSNYAHTPSPSPANQGQQQQQQQQQQNTNRQYQDYNQFGTGPTNNEGSQQSRPSSVNSGTNQNPPTPNQNYQQANQQQNQQNQQPQQQQTVYTTVSAANFSPSSNNQQTQYVNASSGNGQPGYPQVNASSPQVVSHSSSGYPGSEQYGGQPNQQQQWQHQQQQQQQQQQQEQMMWDKQRQDTSRVEPSPYQQQQQQQQQDQYQSVKMRGDNMQKAFSQADKVNLNSRIKTMILNKQQNDNKTEQELKNVEQQSNNQNTGHFLWYSHHHHLDPLSVDGGPPKFPKPTTDDNTQAFAQDNFKLTGYDASAVSALGHQSNDDKPQECTPFANHHHHHHHHFAVNPLNRTLPFPSISAVNFPPNGLYPKEFYARHPPYYVEPQHVFPRSNNLYHHHPHHHQYHPSMWPPPGPHPHDFFKPPPPPSPSLFSPDVVTRIKADKSPPKIVGEEIPRCHCFPADQNPPEPGTYYTHLGCANNLRTLRRNLECQTGLSGSAIRIEKVKYTGKEGKTAQGCPIVKWIHRRVCTEEKYLVIVKHRTGHSCHSAFIVVCLVVWEGVARGDADELYTLLTEKLTKFGLPTKRRCATNDPRTCACQGVDEDTCGASFSFGCSWSMYYNGCKFTRSKDVRKFRLSVKEEERSLEEKLEELADHVAPIYRSLAPESFENQTKYEKDATACRLGKKPGRPFSGVTACVDFCAHAHKDIHNMNNGCTVVVTLTKHRGATKPREEQLHVLPLYVPADSDEFDSKDGQKAKVQRGEVEVLEKYECEVRTFSEPAEKCRNRKTKKHESPSKRKSSSPSVTSTTTFHPHHHHHQQSAAASPNPPGIELQNGHVSSTTVFDAPPPPPPPSSPSIIRPTPNNYWRYDNLSGIYECNSNINNSGGIGGVQSNGNNLMPGHSSSNSDLSVFKVPQPFGGVFGHHYGHVMVPPSGLDGGAASGGGGTPSKRRKSVDIKYTDNSECFRDPDIGGVAIALSHGSVLFECAKHELHATTALRKPDRTDPTRISLVFYQHRSLNKAQHGLDDYALRQKIKSEGKSVAPAAAALADVGGGGGGGSSTSSSCFDQEQVLRAAALTTRFPSMYPPCIVPGSYQEQFGAALPMPNY